MLVETFRQPDVNMRAILLSAVPGTSNGNWCRAEGYEKFSIHILPAANTTFTAQVRVSNAPAPLDSEDGVKYGNDISSEALAEIKIPVRWIKVKLTANSGGSVSAYMEASSD